jgi:hypothetical protein
MPSIKVKNAISDLKGLKTIAADKADKASSSRIDQQIQASQIKGAESRITQAEASVTRYEQQKDKAEDKLSPPPTKTIPSDGKKGGSKTVVDEREKDKLQAQVRAADLQIQQAQAAVEAARAEADELKGNILVSAGLTEQQANDMGSLQSQIDELTTLANDEQTDLTSDDYQSKLKSASDLTKRLKDELPDNANAALEDFWKDVGAGFDEILQKLTEQTTPPPADIGGSGSNYAKFFTDIDQGYDAIIAHLETNGERDETIAILRGNQSKLTNKSDLYFGGMNARDENSMVSTLTYVNELMSKINAGEEAITAEDIQLLINKSDETTDVLLNQGRDFENTISIYPNTIKTHLDTIKINNEDNEQFMGFYSRIEGVMGDAGNSPELLKGITTTEVDQIKQYYDLTLAIKEKINDGDTPSAEEMTQLINDGDQILDLMINKFGFTDGTDGQSNTGNSNGNSSGSSSSSRGGRKVKG